MEGTVPEYTSAMCEVKQTFNIATAKHCELHHLRKERVEGGKCVQETQNIWFWLNAQVGVDESVTLKK